MEILLVIIILILLFGAAAFRSAALGLGALLGFGVGAAYVLYLIVGWTGLDSDTAILWICGIVFLIALPLAIRENLQKFRSPPPEKRPGE